MGVGVWAPDVGVAVTPGVWVTVGVNDGVGVSVPVGVIVGVAVTVGDGVGDTPTAVTVIADGTIEIRTFVLSVVDVAFVSVPNPTVELEAFSASNVKVAIVLAVVTGWDT